jgi:flagellar secretion chaperone FliS
MMFGTYGKKVAAYQQVGLNTDVATADPHQLIALLFDGAVAAIGIAKGALTQRNIAEKGGAISKAIDIIDNGLRASLDHEKGGDLAERLDALYEYMSVRLLHANIKNDVAALDEVAGLLREIQEAWAQIRPQVVEQRTEAPAG